MDSGAPIDHPTVSRVARRGLLRGGAVLAGTAGLAAASAVAGAPAAHAANGDPVLAGQTTTATSTTTLSATVGSTQPALSLQNSTGPALQLNVLPDSFSSTLAVGQIGAKADGPIVGVNYGNGTATTYLATGVDLQLQSLPVAISPERLLDTRTPAGQSAITAASSSQPLDSAGRLKGGQWIDLGIAPTDAITIDAIFGNLTVLGSSNPGYLIVYPPGPRPVTSAINYAKGATIANGGFFATAASTATGFHTLRIYASATTHVLFDLTGYVGPELVVPAAGAAAAKTTAVLKARRSAAKRTVRSMARR